MKEQNLPSGKFMESTMGDIIDSALIHWARTNITRLLSMPDLENEDIRGVNIVFKHLVKDNFHTVSKTDVHYLTDLLIKYGDKVKPTIFEGANNGT